MTSKCYSDEICLQQHFSIPICMQAGIFVFEVTWKGVTMHVYKLYIAANVIASYKLDSFLLLYAYKSKNS